MLGSLKLSGDRISERGLALIVAAVAVMCLKLMCIGAFAGPVPFWDEWDAQGLRLFLPYLEQKLSLWDWFAAHNEHRATSARVVWLLTFISTGRWDTVAIMMINASIHTAAIIAIAYLLSNNAPRNTALAIIACVSTLLAMPFGWENLIWSLQTMWYFLLLFSVAALWLLCDSGPFSPRWWLAIALSVCAYFSMSSAVAVPIAAAIIVVLQLSLGLRRKTPEYVALLSYIFLVAAMIAYVPQLNPPDDSGLWVKAIAFLNGIIRYASWPMRWSVFSAIALNAPTFIFAVRLMVERAPVRDVRWKIVALAFWIWITIAMIAYGRPTGDGGSSRYQDILLVGLAINLAVVLRAISVVRISRPIMWTGCIWIVAVVGVSAQYFNRVTSRDIKARYDSAYQHVDIIAGYLQRHDRAEFERNLVKLPYPSADRLVDLLSHRDLARSLPAEIRQGTPGRGSLFWSAVVDAGPIRHFLFIMSPLLLSYALLIYGILAVYGRKMSRK